MVVVITGSNCCSCSSIAVDYIFFCSQHFGSSHLRLHFVFRQQCVLNKRADIHCVKLAERVEEVGGVRLRGTVYSLDHL